MNGFGTSSNIMSNSIPNNNIRDWSDDYSYLVHSIEGKIIGQLEDDEYDQGTTSDPDIHIDSNTIASHDLVSSFTHKRQRISNELDNSLIGMNNQYSMPMQSQYMNYQAQIDELQCELEEYREKYEIVNDDLRRNKERHERELIFMDTEIQRFEKMLTEKNDLYFDLKKSYRLLEKQNQQLQLQLQSSTQSSTVSNQGKNDTAAMVDYWKKRYQELEGKYVTQQKDSLLMISQLKDQIGIYDKDISSFQDVMKEKNQLLEWNSELERKLNELNKKNLTSSATIKSLENDNSQLSIRLQSLEMKIRLLSHQPVLYEREITHLRELMKSYEKEMNLMQNKQSVGVSVEKVNAVRENFIAKLQADLDQSRKECENIVECVLQGKSIHTSPPPPPLPAQVNTDEIEAKKKTIEEQKATILRLQQENEDLLMKYEDLQSYTRTDMIPAQTKVLHLADNPYSLACKAVKSFPKQGSSIPIEKLKEFIREQKRIMTNQTDNANTSTSNNNTSSQSLDSSFDNQPTRSTSFSLINNDIMNQRLKETFREMITSFREAVYLLTGYKIDLIPVNSENGSPDCKRLRLRSLYAESPEDSLLFQWRGDTLELLETPFASKLDHRLFTYLNHNNSVPAFLSSVTMELFENQTFMG